MKKLFHFKLLLIAPAILTTSCGYGLKEVYSGIPYNSTNYFENYYNVWDKKINPHEQGHEFSVIKEEHYLDDNDKVFTSTKDANFKYCEPNWDQYAYTYDKTEPSDSNLKAYGPAVCMTKLDDSFKYGVVSKMFDGQMFCNGDFQMSRTQVEPINQGANKGFGVLFSKEGGNASYFMMNLKCSLVYRDNQNLSTYYSDLTIKLGIVLKNDTGYTYVPVKYDVPKVPTNSGDDHAIEPYNGRYSLYTCFGFSLENIETDRLIGFTLQYQYNDIFTYNSSTKQYYPATFTEDIYHSIMLYEVSFPRTTWH